MHTPHPIGHPDPAEPVDPGTATPDTATSDTTDRIRTTVPARTPLVRADLAGRGPVARVVTEWSRLSRRADVLDHVNSWAFIDPRVDHLDDVLERAGFGRPTADSDGDKVLWHLADIARDDDLATRIVLHRILPALMSIARRRGRIHPKGPYAAMEELLTTAWIVIRSYPSERRPTKVASNLVRDCEYHAFVRTQRLRRVDETPVEEMGIIARIEPDPHPADELAEVLADALAAGVAEQDIMILRACATGGTSEELAVALGVSPRTVRNWRRRAIEAVRRVSVG